MFLALLLELLPQLLTAAAQFVNLLFHLLQLHLRIILQLFVVFLVLLDLLT